MFSAVPCGLLPAVCRALSPGRTGAPTCAVAAVPHLPSAHTPCSSHTDAGPPTAGIKAWEQWAASAAPEPLLSPGSPQQVVAQGSPPPKTTSSMSYGSVDDY